MSFSEKIQSVYGSFAFYIASHPWKFCIISFLFNGLLGLGMLKLPCKHLLNNDIEAVYMPRNTHSQETAQNILKIFPDYSGEAYYSHQMVKQPLYTELIIWKENKQSIINESLYDDLTFLVKDVKNISVSTAQGQKVNYLDVCARRNEKCVTDGEEIIEELADIKDGKLPLSKLKSENSTIFEDPLHQLADFNVVNRTIVRATYLKIRFNLCQNTLIHKETALKWMDRFISHMKEMSKYGCSRNLHLTFSHSKSFLEELGNDTYSDIPYFSFVFTIYFIYIGFVMSGGNILAKRVHIGRMGIIVTPTSVLGAWGLLMACEVEFTNVIGITPVLIISHQIINTMITLSHLSEKNDDKDGKRRVAYAVRMSVLPITFTTFCHVVPFAIAISSKYYAVELVGIYMVATILFNYVNHFVFYTACLAIHEERIDAGRHCCICTKLRPRDELEGRNCCIICCCSGSRPEKRTDTESTIEKFTRNAMLRLLLTTPTKCIALISFLVLLAFAVFGLTNYKVDTFQKNEVISDSYFYNWNEVNHLHFKYEPIIQFVTIHPYGFINDTEEILELKNKLALKLFGKEQSLLFWKNIYDNGSHVNYTSELALCKSIRRYFVPEYPVFSHDIHFDKTNSSITASRFYIQSKHISSTKSLFSLRNELFDLLEEINKLFIGKLRHANDSLFQMELDDTFVFVYSADFFTVDNFFQPLWEILIFTGTQLGLLLLLFLLLEPSLSFLILLPLTYTIMISLLFGISYFFEIYLTQVSMVMYMVAGCFFVESIAHIYFSFSKAPGKHKELRMNVALNNASQAVFHSIFGLFLGMLVLFVVRSYVFVTVFRLTILTTLICILFILLWIPTSLSLFGPVSNYFEAETVDRYKLEGTSTRSHQNKTRDISGTENPAFYESKHM